MMMAGVITGAARPAGGKPPSGGRDGEILPCDVGDPMRCGGRHFCPPRGERSCVEEMRLSATTSGDDAVTLTPSTTGAERLHPCSNTPSP